MNACHQVELSSIHSLIQGQWWGCVILRPRKNGDDTLTSSSWQHDPQCGLRHIDRSKEICLKHLLYVDFCSPEEKSVRCDSSCVHKHRHRRLRCIRCRWGNTCPRPSSSGFASYNCKRVPDCFAVPNITSNSRVLLFFPSAMDKR